MGSSYFVGYIATALLSEMGIKSRAYEAKEFANAGVKTVGNDAMIFLVSQSGESKEIIEFCETGLIDGKNVAVVTNNTDGFLYKYGEIKFLLHAGKEYTTATKTYTNTVASILYICNLILESKKLKAYNFYGIANECVKIMQNLIGSYSGEMTDLFTDAEYICLVGGGASYCSASHAELVVEEAGKMYSTRYLPAQFLHGPVELINEKFNAIVLDFSDNTRKETDRIIDNVITYGGKICVITNRDISIKNERLLLIKLDVENEYYTPLVEIMPIELFINDIGLKRGLTPGILTRVRK